MGRLLYNLLLPLYLVGALPGLLSKMRRRGGYGAHFGQRFGWYDRGLCRWLAGARGRHLWWVHAVSVGEVLIAVKLLEAVRARCPAKPLVLSTTSSTGYATAREKAPEGVRVIYNPLDLPGLVSRVLRRLDPRVVILMESELWPNLIAAAARQGRPVVIANARLSERSGRRYARFRPLVEPTLNRLTAVLTQEEGDGRGWAAAGLEPGKVLRVGSVKFDPAGQRAASEEEVRPLRKIVESLWGAAERERRFVLLLGSSHAGEEKALMERYVHLRGRHPQLRLVLVPRHFERASALVEELAAVGPPVVRRSLYSDSLRGGDAERGEGSVPEPPVLLVDSTGELRAWYALANAVVIGKSFQSIGGQNPVEPLLAGCPVVAGPHMENFAALTRLLEGTPGFCQVPDWAALEARLDVWLREPGDLGRAAGKSREALAVHAGATGRTVEKLLEIAGETA